MTHLLEAILFGFVLSLDSFSAALALGFRKHQLKDSLLFAFLSGSSEAFVTYIGVILGSKIILQYDLIDHWIIFFLLTSVSLHMGYEGIKAGKLKDYDEEKKQSFYSPMKLLVVSFATSLDAFAIGLSLGIGQKPLGVFISAIGICAFIATILGMMIAKRASSRWGQIFSLFGCVILFSMAIHTLLTHLR